VWTDFLQFLIIFVILLTHKCSGVFNMSVGSQDATNLRNFASVPCCDAKNKILSFGMRLLNSIVDSANMI